MLEPEKGFYYHHKHDPKGPVNNYAYEVLNIAHHTEIEDLSAGAMVVYRPIYEARVYNMGKHWDVRPLGMFMESVEKEGKTVQRFTKIVDENLIFELESIKNKLYP